MDTPCPPSQGPHRCPLTLEAGGDGEVHGPAHQRHDQPQEDEEDPVLAHLGDEEPLALQGADCGDKGRLRDWGGQAGGATGAHNRWHRRSTTDTVWCRSTAVPSHATASSGQERWAPWGHRWARTSHQHSPPGTAPGRGAGGPPVPAAARLFWAIVYPPPGGQVALSSAPVSHDSRRNPTLCRRGRVGSRALTRGCAHQCPRPVSPSPVSLTAAGATAALGVLQQLRGAAWLGGTPLPVPLLQPQPGRLVLGEGAQVLRVAPIHLGGRRSGRGRQGAPAPQLLRPSGETEAGELQASWHGLPAPGGARRGGRWWWAPLGKGQSCLRGFPAARRGVGGGRAAKEHGDRWPASGTSSWHCRYQSPALPRCPRHRAGLAEGGEGPPAMVAWPGDSPRARIGVVLALCGRLPLASLNAGLGSPGRQA